MRGFSWVVVASLLLSVGCGVKQLEAEALSNPDSSESWEALGDAYARSGRKDKARQAYARALEMSPDNEALEEKAASVGGGRELRKIQRMILKYPESDEAWGRAGVMAYEAGYNTVATQYLQQALSIDPQDGEWFYYLSQLLSPEDFLALSEATLAAFPQDDEMIGGVAWMLWEVEGGIYRERACDAFAEALALDPEDEEWQEGVNACVADGRADAVAGLSEDACLEVDGGALDLSLLSDPVVLKAVAESLLSGGAREQALASYQRLLRVEPGVETAQAVALLEGSEVLEVLEALVAEDVKDWRRQLALGDHRAALGDIEAAAEAWQAAASYAINEPSVRSRLALLPVDAE